MKKELNFKVTTEFGTGFITQIYISELGHLLAKIFYPGENKFINHTITNMEDLLKTKKIEPDEKWTKKIGFS